ncbi:FecR domain-containing protein [Blastopirellula marina]|uniref:FecR protein domain-containing protein n=1 Tax=Blastopirellula marina DSM 3645 TaxID=314230 RepID=A3ZPM3_9BACT|nr:hypothetical protein [Blastopirellula marina]EAQ81701.1 hypothetical protein DSM3645_29007 [Blastopirellula marina DSM 3645]
MSKLNPHTSDELVSLARGYCDERLDAAQVRRLEELLRNNPENQRRFIGYLDLHARLCWEARSGEPILAEPNVPKPTTRRTGVPRAVWFSAAIAVSLLMGFAWWTFRIHPATPPMHAIGLATVVRAVGRWGDDLETIRPGLKLENGVFELSQGVVELAWPSGVRMILESPTRLELVDHQKVILHTGRVVTRVPASGVGFVMETERVRLVDLGTEFGVSVGLSGATDVQVYEGAVDVYSHAFQGNVSQDNRLSAGEAYSFDKTSRALPFAPERFLRTFPKTPRKTKTELAYNRSEIEMIHVRRTAQPPVIDGNLEEWDLSEAFTAACIEPYAATYHAQGMIRYDDQRIYIAMHIADPAPMASMTDPEKEPAFFWTGGSVVLRVGADNQLGWPLNASKPGTPLRGRQRDPAKDASRQIVHIGMWYSKPQEVSQLILQYGIRCDEQVLASEGWQGAFRRDADGLGYTLEYAIDYELLHASPPQPGDVWASTLAIHWSDQDGRTCMGRLLEITHQSQTPFRTFDAATWGKLVFDP